MTTKIANMTFTNKHICLYIDIYNKIFSVFKRTVRGLEK